MAIRGSAGRSQPTKSQPPLRGMGGPHTINFDPNLSMRRFDETGKPHKVLDRTSRPGGGDGTGVKVTTR